MEDPNNSDLWQASIALSKGASTVENVHNLLIVGAGAAGLAAGIYGGRARLDTLILEKGPVGGTAYSTRELANYPGFHADGISGPYLMKEMEAHAKKFGCEIQREKIVDMDLEGDIKVVRGKKGAEYKAEAVILAFGTEPRLLDIPGERRLRGSGVSYCATCDAENYDGEIVAVLGNGDAALEEAMYIAKFATKVIVIVIHDEGIVDCNRISAEKAFKHPKLEFVWNSTLQEIQGEEEVESIVIRNLKTGECTERKVGGVFFYVGLVPQTAPVQGKVEMNPQGYIITNERMETSIPGVYAVGDCISKYLRQVVTATADGAIAAVAAEKYLEEAKEYREIMRSEAKVLLAFWSPTNQVSIDALALAEPLLAGCGNRVKLVKIDMYRKTMMARKLNVASPGTFVLLDKGKPCGLVDSSSQDGLRTTLKEWTTV